MSDPAGLDERPADGRTLGTKSFAALAASSIALIERSAPRTTCSSSKALLKRSAHRAKRSSLQNIPTQVLIVLNIF